MANTLHRSWPADSLKCFVLAPLVAAEPPFEESNRSGQHRKNGCDIVCTRMV